MADYQGKALIEQVPSALRPGEMKLKITIPELPKKRILELAEQIRPIQEFPNFGLCYIKPVDPIKIAFTWDAKPDTPATGLKKLGTILTYHTWAYYGFFKPSIGEVLRQIPDDLLARVVAFSIEIDDSDGTLASQWDVVNADHHRARTTLYEKA